MKKRDIDGLIVGFSCRDLKAKGIAIFVYIKNGSVHLEFLGIGSDITESRCNISFKGTRLVFPASFGAIDFIEIPMGQCVYGIPSLIRPGKIIPGSVANSIGHHIASNLFYELNEFNVIETGTINKYSRALL